MFTDLFKCVTDRVRENINSSNCGILTFNPRFISSIILFDWTLWGINVTKLNYQLEFQLSSSMASMTHKPLTIHLISGKMYLDSLSIRVIMEIMTLDLLNIYLVFMYHFCFMYILCHHSYTLSSLSYFVCTCILCPQL